MTFHSAKAGRRTNRKGAGFSLLEVLVALLILAVGMGGIATLLAHTLLTTRTTVTRTQAFHLSADMAERIRANRQAVVAYRGEAIDHDCEQRAASAPCTATERAEQDLFDWSAAVATRLPDGAGSIEIDDTAAPANVSVTLRWSEPGAEPDDTARYRSSFPLAER